MGKPFKINQPPAVNTNEMRPVLAEPAGRAMVRSGRTGDPLPAPSAGAPDHPPTIPWPPAVAVEHKPMKLKE